MTARERTRQQLDPAGTTVVRGVTSALMIGAFLYAVVVTLQEMREIVNPVLAILSLAALAASAIVVIIEASPYRAPMSRGDYLVALCLALIAVFFEAAGSFGSDAFVRDDWGPLVLGIVFVAAGPYRPARELAVSGLMAVLFVGLVVLTEVRWFVVQAPPLAFVIVACAPALAMCLATVAYSLGIVTEIERWQRRAHAANREMVAGLRVGMERSVRQDRVTILGRDVLPFFSEVLAHDRVTDGDRERAREISRSIRNVMVAEANRSWLETVVHPEPFGENDEMPAVIDDRDRLAQSMTTDQRTALRAFLVALVETPGLEVGTVRVRITRDGELCRTVIEAGLGGVDLPVRQTLAPYIALLRSTFEAFDVDFDHPSLRLRFWYEQH